MSGRIIPTIFGKGWIFPGIQPLPTFWNLMVPWNCHGDSQCVIQLAGWGSRFSRSWLVCTFFKKHGSGLVTKPCPTHATPWTVACQAPLSMGFSRQEYWSDCHSLLQGIFPTQGSNPGILHCRQTLPNQLQGKPLKKHRNLFKKSNFLEFQNDFHKYICEP